MIFLSYCFSDDAFVRAVNENLTRQPHIRTFFYGEDQRAEGWQLQTRPKVDECDSFVLFLGDRLGEGQADEAIAASKRHIKKVVVRTEATSMPREVGFFDLHASQILVDRFDDRFAAHTAERIIKVLGLDNPFDLPDGYPFDYEKKIIEAYSATTGIGPEFLKRGCPAEWPSVEQKRDSPFDPNPVGEEILGSYRKESAAVIVDNRIGWRDPEPQATALTFPEAGPREMLCYPIEDLTVGILVSGGIAPGINAVIESIVMRHTLYHKEYLAARGSEYRLEIRGYLEGFEGFVRRPHNWRELDAGSVRGLAGQAGAKLRTSRADELLKDSDGDTRARYRHFRNIITKLKGVDILYVIGGEGSMKAAHAIWKISRDIGMPLSVVGVPKTMDNDILWVWQSFGFLSAVEQARTMIINLHIEATSNPRLSVIQLFGSDSGFVVSHAALGSGVCDAALIPEVGFAIKDQNGKKGISRYICRKLHECLLRGESPSALIVMAETAIPLDALDYVEDQKDECKVRLSDEEKDAVRKFFKNGRRIQGQTPDALRSAGLKIVSQTLLKDIQGMPNAYWKKYRVFSNEPRHLIRSIPPSVSDVIIGERLGALAVDNAMAGYTDFMVSQWVTEYVLVPLRLVTLGRKRVPENGMFWKSVLASTGQPANIKHQS